MDQTPAQKRQIMRTQMWTVLHDGKGTAGRVFSFFLMFFILISVAVIPLEFIEAIRDYHNVIHAIEGIVIAVFTVEYILRIYAAPKRWRYIFSFFGLVDLLSIVPFYAGIFGTEFIRIVHIARFFKLGQVEPAAETDADEVRKKGIGLIDGEHVEHVVTKSPVVLLVGVIPPILSISFGLGILLGFPGIVAISTAITLFLFAFIFFLKAWLDYSYDVIYVTNYRLIFQNQHLLGRDINQVNYQAITNVKPKYPGPLSYMLRYGSLIIDTAAEHPGQIGLHTVRRHEQAAQCIMQHCMPSNSTVKTS